MQEYETHTYSARRENARTPKSRTFQAVNLGQRLQRPALMEEVCAKTFPDLTA
jgi:hypothetical protein